MKPNETMSNTPRNSDEWLEALGEAHALTSYDTPLRPDAFRLSEEEKVNQIAQHFHAIMEILGLDLTDDSLQGTPRRVAKMYVKEIFSGLNPENFPAITLFDNPYQYGEMLVERDIHFHSNCEHHFVPIVGHVHIAYMSSGKVIGLSKLHRIVNHYARRPQVQERMTIQIGRALQEALETLDVAVIVDADHMCVSSRGIKDQSSSTVTSFFEGAFSDASKRSEFLRLIELKNRS